jgi:hypothetical protein
MSTDLEPVDTALEDDETTGPDGLLERGAEYAMDVIGDLEEGSSRGYGRGIVRGMDVGGTVGSLLNTGKDALYNGRRDDDEVLSGEEYVEAKDSSDYSSLSGKAASRQREDDDDGASAGYMIGIAAGLTVPAISAAVNQDPTFLALYGGGAAYGAVNTVERQARSYLEDMDA